MPGQLLVLQRTGHGVEEVYQQEVGGPERSGGETNDRQPVSRFVEKVVRKRRPAGGNPHAGRVSGIRTEQPRIGSWKSGGGRHIRK